MERFFDALLQIGAMMSKIFKREDPEIIYGIG